MYMGWAHCWVVSCVWNIIRVFVIHFCCSQQRQVSNRFTRITILVIRLGTLCIEGSYVPMMDIIISYVCSRWMGFWVELSSTQKPIFGLGFWVEPLKRRNFILVWHIAGGRGKRRNFILVWHIAN